MIYKAEEVACFVYLFERRNIFLFPQNVIFDILSSGAGRPDLQHVNPSFFDATKKLSSLLRLVGSFQD
jgi:hypothetical protein